MTARDDHAVETSSNTLDAGVGEDPFFILGCVRSGTTMLRDVIASHPRLFCPNETHFFRFPDPFGTMSFIRPLMNQKLFKNHRRLDNLDEEMFRDEILLKSFTRGELMRNYARAYLEANNAPDDARWFDKTPQNIYGAALIAEYFPTAKFIHIVRNPLNVVTSLRSSTVMVIKETVGAANYWLESAIIMQSLKHLVGDRLYEVTYDRFTNDPKNEIAKILDFLGENASELTFNFNKIRPEPNKFEKVLPPEDIEMVRKICADHASRYGFSL
ncbi:MAG: sulfotransferase [Pseudomonadota bacterium]